MNYSVKKVLDLRGVECPMNIIIAKKELQNLSRGDIVKIVVDFPAAKEDVPRSLQRDGHKILSITDLKDFTEIFVQV
jgi:TusA-related sulfurtransferase